MSVAEMKLEAINKITNTDNEAVLQKVLALLESEVSDDTAINLSKNYDAIKAQYGNVLQKLAQ